MEDEKEQIRVLVATLAPVASRLYDIHLMQSVDVGRTPPFPFPATSNHFLVKL